MKIKELVIKAINKDCLDKILAGEDSYKCEISEFVAAEVPTDWPNIIRTIYTLHKENPDLLVDNKFEEAINRLCDKGYYELYCAIMVVFFQVISEKKHTASFYINREFIFNCIQEKLYIFEEDLKSCKEWTGKRYQDGLWGDIRRVNTILYEDYEISFLK